MSSRLADRLAAARRRRFVGREPERALFQAALNAPELPFCILYIFGPGGIGKTTLLKEFAYLTEAAEMHAFYLDARNIDPAPESFIAALQAAMGLQPPADPLDELDRRGGRNVILIDTYEVLAPLDNWLREDFLPDLPDDTLVVFAGRRPLASAWRGDAGWEGLVRVLPLRNLNPEESRAYLSRREIPVEQHQEVLAFTHGHPLALSLVADVFAQRGDFRFRAEAEPDIVKALLEELVQKVPGPAHRTALEVCALVRLTTEDLLADVLGIADPHELFEWLRGLSLIDSGPQGLFPHDLAREALVADLRWRNPTWYAELHRRARSYYSAALQRSTGQEQQRILFNYLFLHRENPVVRSFFEWQETGTSLPDVLHPQDRPALLAMVAQHEGGEAAALAEFWMDRQPQSVLVFRDIDRQPTAFLMLLPLEQIGEDTLRADPATHAAWRYLQTHAPMRPGDRATHFRFWMARDSYQGVSAAQSLIFINAVRHYFTPGLVYTFFPCADADFWTPLFAYADLNHLPAADFAVGGRHFSTFGHDWRAVPPMAWLGLMAEREMALAPPTAKSASAPAPLLVLNQEDFACAVRDALRDFARPDGLHTNPLLQSRLVLDQAGAGAATGERVAALQGLLKRALEALESSPQEAKLYRALYHTYLHPAPTQEQAAELLDLPFSTFRRHLKGGVSRMAEVLWQWELQGLGI
jgi:hypothetical protein